MSSKIRVVHIINSFEFGGAEAMLCRLLLRSDRDRFESSVISLIDDMTVAGSLLKAGIPVVSLGMRPGVPDPRGPAGLAQLLRRMRPAVVQTWMDHSNLIGSMAARLAGSIPVVWGIHHSNHVAGLAKRTTLWTVKACALLSRWLPSRIVCCSQQAKALYSERGFADEKLVVIPNGFDTDVFQPDPAARSALRQELGLGYDVPLVGLMARYDPFKDHANFLKTAARLIAMRPDARFLMCGHRVDRDNRELMDQIERLGLLEHCHLLGPRLDMPRVYPALDVAVSSSISEAFPLAVGEAMACGVPCVATDVGDSALIVGSTGRIVPASDPTALAAGCAELLSMDAPARQQLGLAARQRVKELFDLDGVTRRYESIYRELADRPASGYSYAPASAANGNGHVHLRGGRKLRVLLVVESSAGGTGRHVLDLAEGLIDRRCEVHLVYSTGRIDRPFEMRVAAIKGLRCKRLTMRTVMHPADAATIRAVRRYASEFGPFDIVHGHSSKGGAIARLAAIGTEAAAFYTIHGLILVDPSLARWKRMIYRIVERLLSCATAGIVAVSPEEARAAVRLGLGESRVMLIPNGIGPIKTTPREEARAALKLSDDSIAVGFVGRLVDQKAPDVLIEAFAQALSAESRLRLLMVGAGPMETTLRGLAWRLGVSNKVMWLHERDARTVFAAFDMFALASRKEGMPYVVLEAMAAGLPIVATTTAGIESLVADGINGRVVPPDQAGALADALLATARDGPGRERLGRASRERAALFTLDAMVDRTLDAYRGVARHNNGNGNGKHHRYELEPLR